MAHNRNNYSKWGGIDHDVIKVVGAGDNFRSVKIKISNSGLNMTRMVITYDGGGLQKIDIRKNIPKGGESRVIDLNGGKRSIRKIEFWYKDTGFLNGRAKVTVLGRK